MDKQRIIVVLLLITIVFSVVSIILTVGVNYSNLNQIKIIKYSAPGQGSASLVVLPPGTQGVGP